MNKMAEQIIEVQTAVNSLNEIQEDASVPRNVRMQVKNVIGTLKEDIELPIKINKALNKLDEIASDINLQAYTRTQIWNVVSVLEKL